MLLRRPTRWITALSAAVMLALGGCGGGSDDAADSDPAMAETTLTETTQLAETETTVVVSAETTSEEAGGLDSGDDVTCDQALTADEIDSILGTSAEVSGSGAVCSVRFADDSIGTLQVFSGSRGDEAMDVLLPKFMADETASANGVLLADDRGFVDGRSAIVRGDSGNVFRFDVPGNVEMADVNAAMQQLAALLQTR